jgi:hypothetical protein
MTCYVTAILLKSQTPSNLTASLQAQLPSYAASFVTDTVSISVVDFLEVVDVQFFL